MNRCVRTLAVLLSTLLIATASAAPAKQAQRQFTAGTLNVMTQNLYVGGDILLPIAAPPDQFPAAAALVIEQIIATNFPERAKTLAQQMLARRPDLIGLQEVFVVKVCPKGFPEIYCVINQDYLEILLDELNANGTKYRVASSIKNIDLQGLEVAVDDQLTLLVTLTDRDVILARSDVQTHDEVSANYAARLPVPTLPGFSVIRGWTMVDAVVAGREIRFLNTHLEVSGAGSAEEPVFRALQFAQAMELVADDGPLGGDQHVQVVVGDFNSDPSEGPLVTCGLPDGNGGLQTFECATPYAVLAGARFVDTWLERGGPWSIGYTCCQATLLDNPEPSLEERIDHVFMRPAPDHFGGPYVRGVRAEVVGDEVADRTPVSGLWPSDHAGVATSMVLRVPR